MKTSEIFWELPNCDPEIWSEQMLLEKQRQQTCLTQGGHKPSIFLKKENEIISEAKIGLYSTVLGELYLPKFKESGVSDRDPRV